MPPDQPGHLLTFSKQRTDLPTLNYGSARKAISDYQQKQKYEQVKSGGNRQKIKSFNSLLVTNNLHLIALIIFKISSDPHLQQQMENSTKKSLPEITKPPQQNLPTTNLYLQRSRSGNASMNVSPEFAGNSTGSAVPSSFGIDAPETPNTTARRSATIEPLTTNISNKDDNLGISNHIQSISTMAVNNDPVEDDYGTLNGHDDEIELSVDDRENKSIVIDNGTSLLKVGYVGDDKPFGIFHPTQICNGRKLKSNPIERGIIKDLYKIEDVYKYAFREVLHLKDDQLKEYGVIMNCAAFNPRQTAEELCELMFETFGIEKFLYHQQLY